MTSQKRYRHHQDSGSNRDRFKDIPPRFKRQKSSSSPTRPLSPSNGENNKTTHTREADSQNADLAVLTAAAAVREPISSGIYQFKEKVTDRFEPGSDKLQTQKLPGHTTWKHPQEHDNIYAASSWNKQDYLGLGFQQPAHVSLGTHFGYKTNLDPLYSWAPVDAVDFYGHPDVTEDPVWTNSYPGQRIHHSSGYIGNNENLASGQYMQALKPQDCWDLPSSVQYPTSSSPPSKNSTSSLPAESGEKMKSNKETDTNMAKQIVDYSDPDIRTIEMLRELERVADQKERENEEFGADRKSLVSHHLRMLMCAVDRYTEGIEDDLAMVSRHDEVRPAPDSRGSTPGVSADLVNSTAHEQTGESIRNKMGQNLSLQSPKKNEHSIWTEPSLPFKTSSKLTNQTEESYVLSLHTSPSLRESDIEGKDTAAWDLWSSPTFDFCNVLTNHSSDISRVRSVKERQPLYQRQMQNF